MVARLVSVFSSWDISSCVSGMRHEALKPHHTKSPNRGPLKSPAQQNRQTRRLPPHSNGHLGRHFRLHRRSDLLRRHDRHPVLSRIRGGRLLPRLPVLPLLLVYKERAGFEDCAAVCGQFDLGHDIGIDCCWDHAWIGWCEGAGCLEVSSLCSTLRERLLICCWQMVVHH